MNELRRMAYLDALGIDAYVSRAQLPGAALTRRLVIVPAPASDRVASAPSVAASPVMPATAPPRQAESQIPTIDSDLRSPASTPAPPTESPRARANVPHFNLFTIAAGGWLWLEDLGDMPLASDQVQLVQAMARALAGVSKPSLQSSSEAARPDAAPPRCLPRTTCDAGLSIPISSWIWVRKQPGLLWRDLSGAGWSSSNAADWCCWGRPAARGCRWSRWACPPRARPVRPKCWRPHS